MTVCPKCGYTRRPEDQAPDYECPKCGIVYAKYLEHLRIKNSVEETAPQPTAATPVPEPSATAAEGTAPAVKKPRTLGDQVYGWLVILVIVWAVFPSGSDKKKATAAVAPTDHSSSAFVRCQRYVRDRLKAPATADFPFLDRRTWKFDDDVYVVKSYVDAQNSFGAMLRTNWHCKVQYVGGDWKLLELELINP